MIVPDANLLLYAYDSTNPFHAESAGWWTKSLSGTEPVGFCPSVLFAFVRIASGTRAFARPMTIREASELVERWLDQPMVQVLAVEGRDVLDALNLLKEAGTGGNLTSDAQIAAVARRMGAVIHTADSDYARFPGVRWFNPVTGRSSR